MNLLESTNKLRALFNELGEPHEIVHTNWTETGAVRRHCRIDSTREGFNIVQIDDSQEIEWIAVKYKRVN